MDGDADAAPDADNNVLCEVWRVSPSAVDAAASLKALLKHNVRSSLRGALADLRACPWGASLLIADEPLSTDLRTGARVTTSPLEAHVISCDVAVRRHDVDEDGSLLVVRTRPPPQVQGELPLSVCSSAEHFAPQLLGGPKFCRMVAPSLATSRPQRTCAVCECAVPTAWLLWCEQCHECTCVHCLQGTPLGQLDEWERTALLGGVAVDSDAQISRAGESDAASGEWPATDESGRLTAWFLWTGTNPLPAYLQLCMDSFAHAAADTFNVRLVRPWHLAELLDAHEPCGGDPTARTLHPAYEALSLVHKADYLRCELLHRYGGLYADVDTLCLNGLHRALRALARDGCAAVLPSASILHEAGMNVGLFRRNSQLTRRWRAALWARLDARQEALWEYRRAWPTALTEDALDWNEILRDVLVPLVSTTCHLDSLVPPGVNGPHGEGSDVAVVRQRACLDLGESLRARLWLPSREQGFDPLAYVETGIAAGAEGGGSGGDDDEVDVLVLTNNQYAGQLKTLSTAEFLASNCMLARLVQRATGL